MKLAKILAAAGLTVAAVTMSTSADAQTWRDRGHHSSDWDRGHHGDWDRGHHRGWNSWDRGHHYGWNRHHRYCRTMWRHHRRVTICYR